MEPGDARDNEADAISRLIAESIECGMPRAEGPKDKRIVIAAAPSAAAAPAAARRGSIVIC